MFSYITIAIYWSLVIVWSCILYFYVSRTTKRRIQSTFFSVLLMILAIDAFRTLFESIFFGLSHSSRLGFLPGWIYGKLALPEIMFIPKALNLVAALLVVFILIRKWLPSEEAERNRQDITIKKLTEKNRKAEQALRNSEARFRNIVESSPMGIHMYELNASGDLIFTGANAAADTILKTEHAALIGKRIEQAFPPLEFTEVPNRYRDVCTKGIPWHNEDVVYQDRRIAGAYSLTAFQTLPGCMAVQFMDITNRKRAEQELKTTQFAVDNASISILWLTPEGAIVYANQAACELYGGTKDRLLSLTISDICLDADGRSKIWADIKTIRHITHEVRMQKLDGSVFPAEVTSHYLKYDEQELEFIFIVDKAARENCELTPSTPLLS